MSDLFFNKIAAAGLAAALGFIGINKLAGMAVHAEIPSTPAYSKYVPGESTVVEDIPAPFPQAEWIAGIDPVKGAKVFKKCTSCHNAAEGGKNGTGPALWNVVGRPAATGADFSYSSAMASSGITWNYEELDGYLENPKTYLPKNKMAFIGVKKPSDRAAVIEYLRLASNAPIAALTEAAPIPGAKMEMVEEISQDVVEGAEEVVIEVPVEAIEVPTVAPSESIPEVVEDAVVAVEEKTMEVVESVEDVEQDSMETVVDTAQGTVDAVAEEKTMETVDAIEDATQDSMETVVDTSQDTVDAVVKEKADEMAEEIKDAIPTPDE